MKLIRAGLENVRTVVDGEYSFAHQNGRAFDVALLRGPAASGKTTLLEAIAMAHQRVASRGRPARPRDFLRAGRSNGTVELTFVLNDGERQRFGLSDPIAKFKVMLSGAPTEVDPRIERLLEASDALDYFPSHRQLSEPFGMEPAPDEATERRIRLSSDRDKYRGVVPWLREQLLRRATTLTARLQEGGMVMRADAADPLAGFRETLAGLCPWLRLQGLALDGRTPMFLRRNASTPPMFELSASEQDAVLISATINRNPHEDTVVLIDRPDLHAGPEDQVRWLQTLAGRHRCQLIVTSASETLAREIPEAQHVLLS